MDVENAKLAAKHFKNVFNRDSEVDWQHVNGRKGRPRVDDLATPITFREFNKVINKLTQHKAPGINGILPNILKALNKDNRWVLFELMKVWMEDNNIVYDEWKQSKIVPLPKKGD